MVTYEETLDINLSKLKAVNADLNLSDTESVAIPESTYEELYNACVDSNDVSEDEDINIVDSSGEITDVSAHSILTTEVVGEKGGVPRIRKSNPTYYDFY